MKCYAAPQKSTRSFGSASGYVPVGKKMRSALARDHFHFPPVTNYWNVCCYGREFGLRNRHEAEGISFPARTQVKKARSDTLCGISRTFLTEDKARTAFSPAVIDFLDQTRVLSMMQYMEERRGTISQGLINSEDGTSIYYEACGEGKPLIFCYGLVCERGHWRHQIAHFLSRYQVITFDYRGHHRSSIPRNDRNLTLEWCARDIEALISHLGLSQVLGLGHSMGVPVLAHLANRVPKLVKGLVLVCGSTNNPFLQMFNSNRMYSFYKISSRLFDLSPELVSRIWSHLTEEGKLGYFISSQFGFNPRLSQKKDIRMYMRSVNSVPLWVFQSLLRDYTAIDGKGLLKNIACPALIVAGEEDLITPIQAQEEMSVTIPDSKLVKIPGGSHNAHMDRPQLVNEEIEQFLKSMQYI